MDFHAPISKTIKYIQHEFLSQGITEQALFYILSHFSDFPISEK